MRYFSAGISRPLLPPAKALREAWRAWNEANEGFAALSPAPAAGEALGSRTAKRVNIMAFGGGVIRWETKGGSSYIPGRPIKRLEHARGGLQGIVSERVKGVGSMDLMAVRERPGRDRRQRT